MTSEAGRFLPASFSLACLPESANAGSGLSFASDIFRRVQRMSPSDTALMSVIPTFCKMGVTFVLSPMM